MAIEPAAEYPSQIITGDPGYPLGKPRNVTVPSDGTGTPLEAKWLADLFGFQQALLDAASITPSGDPDEVGASDYLDALEALFPAIARMDTAENDIDALEAADIAIQADVNALEASRVTGPASATDEAFARFDGTTGKLVQDGAVKATNAGAVTGVTSLVMGGALSGVSSLTMSGAINLSPGIARGVYISAAKFRPGRTTDAIALGTFSDISIQNNGGFVALDLDWIPDGSTITRITVFVNPGEARSGANRMRLEIHLRTLNITGPSVGSDSITTQYDDTTTNTQLLEVTGLSLLVSKQVDGYTRSILVFAGNTAVTFNDTIYGAYVEFTQAAVLGY